MKYFKDATRTSEVGSHLAMVEVAEAVIDACVEAVAEIGVEVRFWKSASER